jgi:hypothetical protein
MEVELFTVKLVAGVPSKLTAVASSRFVPIIVTHVPPAVPPESGLRSETVGLVDRAAWAVTMPVPHDAGSAQAPAAKGVVVLVSWAVT